MHLGLRKRRAADHVIVGAGTDRIEAQGAENVPSRHLTAVVVAAQRVGLGAVLGSDHLMHSLLGLPRLAGVAVEVNDVMARLVAVPVLADAALNVIGSSAVAGLEQLAELSRELLAAPHHG